jgi:hypothetical protein
MSKLTDSNESNVMHNEAAPSLRPNKHIVALMTFFSLLPLVYFIPPFVASYFVSNLAITIVSVAIIVPVISYVLLPVMIKIFYK